MSLEEIAEQYAEKYGDSVADLLQRWDGHPEKIAEDLFQTPKPGDETNLELFRPYQPKILHSYFYSGAKIINIYKGRRIGVSFTTVLAYLIDGIANEEQFFPIVSTRLKSSENRISDIKKLINNANVEIPLDKKPTKGEIRLWNGTTFRAYTGNPDSARGDDSARSVMLDEMAFLEDQQATTQAFMPFISLGEDSKMVQISTPNAPNDKFLQTHENGSKTVSDGVLSIKQPSFKNADEIDIETSLFEQDVEPVRPDFDLRAVETERKQDPQGFGQEYLCRTADDSYRFFSEASIEAAQERGDDPNYSYGEHASPMGGGDLVAGVDLGTSDDETVVSVFEHANDHRFIRYYEVIDNKTLKEAGINEPDRANPNHIAKRLLQIKESLGVEHWVLDNTSMGGEAFESIIRESIGRGVHGFNFSDKDSVKEMMQNLNYGLRNDNVTLVPDKRMKEQLCAIVKEQKEDWSKPKFTGKDYSPDGKDDIAMSVMLGAYPCMIEVDRDTTLRSKDNARASQSNTVGYTGASQRFGNGSGVDNEVGFGSRKITRAAGNRSSSYDSRHGR